jgi:ribosomal protein S27AE
MSICLDCKTSSRKVCPVHAATDNHSDSVDLEIARLKEELEMRTHMFKDAEGKLNDVLDDVVRLTKENRWLRERKFIISCRKCGAVEALAVHAIQKTPGQCGYSSLPGYTCTREPGHGGQHYTAPIERPTGDSE